MNIASTPPFAPPPQCWCGTPLRQISPYAISTSAGAFWCPRCLYPLYLEMKAHFEKTTVKNENPKEENQESDAITMESLISSC